MEISTEGKRLTFGMVARALKLSKLQIRTIFSGILREPQPGDDEVIEDQIIAVLFLADLLEKIAFLLPEQRTAVLTEICTSLFPHPEFERQFNQIVFIDGRFCTWTGQTGFLDLNTGERAEELLHPAMETIGYNLNELYRREKLRIEKRNGFHVKKHHAGSVDEQGNVRISVADAADRPLRLGSNNVGPDHDHDGD